MRFLRSWFAVVLASLWFSTILIAGECDFVPGYRHGNGGGFVALTAYVEPSVYIGSSSKVCGFNVLLGNAVIDGSAEISGFASISGKVTVKDTTFVGEYARLETDGLNSGITITTRAKVMGNAVILDRATISDDAQIYGHARVEGTSTVQGNAQVYGHAQISNSKIFGSAQIHGLSVIEMNSQISGNSTLICDDITLTSITLTQGNTYCQGRWRIFAASSNASSDKICIVGSLDGQNKGNVFCWIAGPPTVFPTTQNITNATFVAAGANHSCAIIEDGVTPGQVRCWGANGFGQLGNNNGTSLYAVGITHAYKIAVGDYHTCALTNDGINKKTYCWGYNLNGQLGIGNTNPRVVPTEVTGISDPFTDVVAGTGFTCGVHGDANITSAKCWGLLSYGQLGTGVATATNTLVPTAVSNLSGFGNYPLKQITAGLTHVCAYDSNFQVICWGNNGQGQFGNSTSISALQLPTLSSFLGDNSTSIHAFAYGMCAHVKDNEKIFCWGQNNIGQVGIDSTDLLVTTPQEVATSQRIKVFGNQANTSMGTNPTDAIYYWGTPLKLPTPLHDDI